MDESISKMARISWTLYLLPGYLVGGIKFLCVATWFFFEPVAATFGYSERFSVSGFFETVIYGLVTAGLMVVGWPVALYLVIKGAIQPGELLFFPWIGGP
jgi:hypothetical protein